ncbi:MAG: PEP-utilizing enzyme [Patescibacteria group bacterium]
MELSDFKKHTDWVKVWSSRGSLAFDSHFGDQCTKQSDISSKPFFAKTVTFYKNGISHGWVRGEDKDDLGDRLSSLAREDSTFVEKISNGLISHTDRVASFIDSQSVKNFGLVEFNEFWKVVQDYFLYHVSVKYIVDRLSIEDLDKFLPTLEKARLYCEPAYRNIENYIELLAERVVTETSYTKEMILALTKEEFRSYFQGNLLPDKAQLKNRHESSVLIFDSKESQVFTGMAVDEIEKIVSSFLAPDLIKGQVAFVGKVIGKVKVISNPLKDGGKFDDGDILVTGMTRPEFLPLMKKAAAFVTDAGGILSHVAITARELKKPCVISTQVASKVLKDGDLVEVDANLGIVKILKRNGDK